MTLPHAPETAAASLVSPGLAELRAALLGWWDGQTRELPWRTLGPTGRRDPYRVWVSEVLLQQTQLGRGRVYFERFLAAFPSVQELAAAPLDDVLKAWEGCGYYARARNLHRAALRVAEEGFPADYGGWLALPGVGPYTAAAIASLAHGERRAVLDGNVRRVLGRLDARLDPSDQDLQARADELLDPLRPGPWNEALMGLGQSVCAPRNPDCPSCPLRAFCSAYRSGDPARFPLPKARARVREVQAVGLLLGEAGRVYLERREGSLLGGLWGLPLEPLGETEPAETALIRLRARLGVVETGEYLGSVGHTMTHRRLTVRLYRAGGTPPRGLALSEVSERALSRLDHKLLALAEAGSQPSLLSAG